jgi:putative inorganic carbon (hco3(-)) transporter
LLHAALTTYLAYTPEFSYPFFDRLWKTMLLAGFVATFMQNRTRLQAVTWVMAMSIAALAFKGAAFSIMTAGQFRVFGPPASQITDNNLFAGAICIALPFLFYLVATTADRRVKLGLTIMAWAMPVAVIFTYSRGGLVTLLAVAFCYFLQSSRKVPIAIAAAATITFAIPLMPDQWVSRMQTISETAQDTSKADGSVQGRFNAWYVYSQIAMDRQ